MKCQKEVDTENCLFLKRRSVAKLCREDEMRHRRMSLDANGVLHIETHNHDSRGESLGRAKTDLKAINAFVAALSEPSGPREPKRRVLIIKDALRTAGLIH